MFVHCVNKDKLTQISDSYKENYWSSTSNLSDLNSEATIRTAQDIRRPFLMLHPCGYMQSTANFLVRLALKFQPFTTKPKLSRVYHEVSSHFNSS